MFFRSCIPLLIACGNQNANFTQQTPDSNPNMGTPVLELSADILYFSDVPSGVASAQKILLSSTGDSTVEVSKAALSNSVDGLFYMEQIDTFQLDPDTSKELTVIVTLTDADFAFGELQIRSNDAENRDRRIPLCANTEGYEISDECDIPE